MEINMSDNQSIAQVKALFTEHFPFLKLEFYALEHKAGEGNIDRTLFDSNKTIGDICSKHNSGELSLHGNQKVSALKQAFHDQYGLNVQVFRKSNEVWLQTTATDEWTLSEQNHTAEEHHH